MENFKEKFKNIFLRKNRIIAVENHG